MSCKQRKKAKNVAENISDFPHTRTQIYTQNEFISDKNAEKLNYDDSDKNQENKNFLLKEQAFRHLKDIILPYWSNLADYQCGGFYGYVDYNLQINKNAQKGVILHSRILWFYSTAYNVIGGEK